MGTWFAAVTFLQMTHFVSVVGRLSKLGDNQTCINVLESHAFGCLQDTTAFYVLTTRASKLSVSLYKTTEECCTLELFETRALFF